MLDQGWSWTLQEGGLHHVLSESLRDYSRPICIFMGFSCLQDKEPRGIIPLENLSIREVEEPRKPVSVQTNLWVRSVQDHENIMPYIWCFASFCRTASSCTIPTIKVRWSRPVRRRQTGGWWRETTWSTGYQRPHQRRRKNGSNPLSRISFLLNIF